MTKDIINMQQPQNCTQKDKIENVKKTEECSNQQLNLSSTVDIKNVQFDDREQ